MEKMAEEELRPGEEEVAQGRAPASAPAPAPAVTPTPTPTPAPAPAPAVTPTPAPGAAPAQETDSDNLVSPSKSVITKQNEDDVSEPELKSEKKVTEVVKDPSSILDPSDLTKERHISIQRQLSDLEKLAFISEDVDSASSLNSDNLHAENKQACPLCPKEKFRACNSHKLRRHLQNLHWKISVEFEGYRMCICHLPCRPVKPNIVGEQMGFHYAAKAGFELVV